MKVEEKGHTVLIKDTNNDISAFAVKVTEGYNSYKERNIIVDITNDGHVALEDILGFLSLSNKHRKAKRSFVIVAGDADYNDMPDEIVVVPTVLEAHDIIEMEEIERDLGF